MKVIDISNEHLALKVTTGSGAILSGEYKGNPFLRPFAGDLNGKLAATKAASFPLVPFGNRVEGNRFLFEGREYNLESNTDWDAHYLHGDGWISEWELEYAVSDTVIMGFKHEPEKGAPYSYLARQVFSVEDNTFRLKLEVTNTGDDPLIFGLGHHLFFPKTPGTTLKAAARFFWTEKHDFLADKRTDIPKELDFREPRKIPDNWVNNGFDGWDGHARICWAEYNAGVEIKGSKEFQNYFIFNSDRKFEPDFKDDYFCFEPMTHTVNAHLINSFPGLKKLSAGEVLNSELVFELFTL